MALVSGPTIGDAIADPSSELTKLVAREKDDHALINDLFLRILNRPATEAEIKACAASIAVIGQDHKALVAALETREAEIAPIHAEQEKEREEAIAAAKAALAAYEKEIAPRVAEQEKAREALIAKRTQEAEGLRGGARDAPGEVGGHAVRVGRVGAARPEVAHAPATAPR